MNIPNQLPCIACEAPVELKSHDGSFSWTYGGIWMVETGNYGSRVLDCGSNNMAVFMVLCDKCIVSRHDRMRGLILNSADQGDTREWEWLDKIPDTLIHDPAKSEEDEDS